MILESQAPQPRFCKILLSRRFRFCRRNLGVELTCDFNGCQPPFSQAGFSICCSGAGQYTQKLVQGIVSVIAQLGWSFSGENGVNSDLTISVDFKEDWILLGISAKRTPFSQLESMSAQTGKNVEPETVVVNGYEKHSINSSHMKTSPSDLSEVKEEALSMTVRVSEVVKDGTVIDGSFLHGGGQILRTAMVYGAALESAVCVEQVRGSEGLQQRDLAILEGLRKISGGKLHGDFLGSSSVSLSFSSSNIPDTTGLIIDTGCGVVAHAIQTMIPLMLAQSLSLGGSEVEVIFKGATNASRLNGQGGLEISPQIEYIKLVLFPILRRLCRITLDLHVRKKGFERGGEVVVRASTDRWPLPSFELLERGEAATISGAAYSSTGIPQNVLGRFVKGQLRKKDAGAEVIFRELGENNSELGQMNQIPLHFTWESEIPSEQATCGLVVAITSTTGCCFGGDSMGRKGVAAELVGEEAARAAVLAFQRGGCADEHLEDRGGGICLNVFL